MKSLTNIELAQLLRKVAAAYQILDENRFKIIAYDRAADSIERLTSEARDLWGEGKLGSVPGVGQAIAKHMDELFRTGRVKHFDDVMGRVPEAVFPLLLVPGIGPKRAYALVTALELGSAGTVIAELEKAAKEGRIASLAGFGEKSQADIIAAIQTYKKGQIKENRMELPIADGIAQDIISHLEKLPAVNAAHTLGSLRRQVSTIGDIDIAAATKKPQEVIDHFLAYPHRELIEKGPTGASILLHNGRQVDLRVQEPAKYGAMLQYFTGSKHHNIRLREFALSYGLSLNEYGIKHVNTGGFASYAAEETFYKAIGLPWIPPELREDKGEIEAALRSAQGKPFGLPRLVALGDIKGDLHMHTNYDLETSHDLGVDSLTAHLDRARELGYEYIGISDHNPSATKHTGKQIIDIMKRRKDYYDGQAQGKKVHVLVMCEVDIAPDGSLALPEAAFDYVEAVIVSIHSSFIQPRAETTKRVIKALTTHPKVRIFGHPTGRLLTKREGVEIEWKEVFAVCKERDIALEINAYPQRLDLPDTIVYDARKAGLQFCINTDSHAMPQMDMMRYGVSVARRGWCQKDDVVNAMEYNDFKRWLLR